MQSEPGSGSDDQAAAEPAAKIRQPAPPSHPPPGWGAKSVQHPKKTTKKLIGARPRPQPPSHPPPGWVESAASGANTDTNNAGANSDANSGTMDKNKGTGKSKGKGKNNNKGKNKKGGNYKF